MRATYIIDAKGILRHSSVNDLAVMRDVDECLRLVQAFKHTDKHGGLQVCPAGWKPGSSALITDHDNKQTKKYWEEVHARQEKNGSAERNEDMLQH